MAAISVQHLTKRFGDVTPQIGPRVNPRVYDEGQGQPVPGRTTPPS